MPTYYSNPFKIIQNNLKDKCHISIMGKQDFSKSIIYHIRHIESKQVICVGSTTNFTNRKGQYKCHHYNPRYTQYFLPLHKHIREQGGWDAYEIVPVLHLNLTCKEELVVAEQKEMDKHDKLLNVNDSVQNPKKYKEQMRKGCIKHRSTPVAVKEKAKRDKNIEVIMSLCDKIDLSDDTLEKIKVLLEMKVNPYTEPPPKKIRKVLSTNKLGVLGVCYDARNKKYKAQFMGRHIGLFKTIEEAKTAYDTKVQEYEAHKKT